MINEQSLFCRTGSHHGLVLTSKILILGRQSK